MSPYFVFLLQVDAARDDTDVHSSDIKYDLRKSYNQIANLLGKGMGRPDEALPYMQKGMEMSHKVMGMQKTMSSLDIVSPLTGLNMDAIITRMTALQSAMVANSESVKERGISEQEIHRRKQEGLKLSTEYEKEMSALCQAQEEICGPNAMLAAQYSNLGSNCSCRGEDEQAFEYYRKALEINVKVSGHLHTDVADSKYNLALQHKKRKETAIARQLLLECEQIYTTAYGSDHSKTLACKREASTSEYVQPMWPMHSS
jgi:hypothetical protein